MSNYIQIRIELETAIIGNGASESSAIACYGRILNSIEMPSAITGTLLSLKVSYDGTTYKDYYNSEGDKIVITPIADTILGLLPADMSGFLFFKLISNSAEAAERTFKIGMRGL